jgi:hypothetical protein
MTYYKNIKVGSVVAFNMLPDATWFDVLERDGFRLVLREHGTDYAKQYVDVSMVARVKKEDA